MQICGLIKDMNAYTNFSSRLIHISRFIRTVLPIIYIHVYIYIRESLNRFPDFFRMGTFIDSTHMKL